jgi:AcrR family transcriptional regulator
MDGVMSPRNQKQNEQMRSESLEKITKAALQVFSQYGYHGTTIKMITKETGLSYGLIYHYFPSKEKIFLHLADKAFGTSESIMSKALDIPGTAWEKIEHLSKVIVEEAFTHEFFQYFLIGLQAITQGKEIPGMMEFVMKHTSHYEKLNPLIIEAQKTGEAIKGDPDILASAYLSLIQGIALLMHQDKELGKKITPDILTNLLKNKG